MSGTATQQPEPAAPPTPPADAGPPPLDMTSPQLTIRAALTGMLIGGILSASNIYSGLKIGWGFNMSILAMLVSFGFWQVLRAVAGTRPWGMLENNINQTAASSAALVSSLGLVSAIPALILLVPDMKFTWLELTTWLGGVSLVGIAVAIPLRRQMIEVDKLPFPSGIASATTLREMYARGAEAMARVAVLGWAAVFGIVMKLLEAVPMPIKWVMGKIGAGDFKLSMWAPAGWAVGEVALTRIRFSLDPSVLLLGAGGLIGMRAGASLLGGAVLAWLVISPWLLDRGVIRVTITEPLVVLPAEVVGKLPEPPDGYALYRREQRLIEWQGVMTLAERDQLLALSEDESYREAVQRLHRRSQRGLRTAFAGALAAPIPSSIPVTLKSGELRAMSGLDAAVLEKLRALQQSPEWARAVDELSAAFDYTSSVPVITRVTLKAPPPPGLKLPWELTGAVSFNADAGQLNVQGRMTPEQRDALLDFGRELAGRSSSSEFSSEWAAAVLAAFERSNAPREWSEIPPALSERVTYDPAAQRLRARGVLSKDDAAALTAARPDDADWKASIAALTARTAYSPAVFTNVDGVTWLLWPGVTLMVVASLVGFAFSWRSIVRTFTNLGKAGGDSAGGDPPMRYFLALLVVATLSAVVLQITFFGIAWWMAILAVVLSFLLAMVAARVSGETNTTPVGAMGKVTQLTFGALSPGNPVPNLMTASVTGGAASQCADLMHDLKCGNMIGATPWKQVVAQICGVLSGSALGTFFYLAMIPNPQEQLIIGEYPAPAVVQWKAVAEVMKVGLRGLPEGAPLAMAIAAVLGVLLPCLEKILPRRGVAFVPSAAAVGLAFVIPGNNAISMFLGALAAVIFTRFSPSLSGRFLVAICAGLIAGESLTGVTLALGDTAQGLLGR
ncbi:MAG: OPT/YSL family transporter [Phycisphaerales bacterium]|nr:OPT/YSL family transporter [Phycisphaerales bacterium]